MHAFLVSLGVVAVSEIGDKTQLLALLLASRLRRPVPIIAGMAVATLLNHALAASFGTWVASALAPEAMRWIVGLLFLAIAAWALVPDTLDAHAHERLYAGGAFLATVIAFFLAEFGDKTQIATIGLAARFGTLLPVLAGTTLGMLGADIPAVLFGHLAGERIAARWVRYAAAACFAALGLATLAGAGFV